MPGDALRCLDLQSLHRHNSLKFTEKFSAEYTEEFTLKLTAECKGRSQDGGGRSAHGRSVVLSARKI